MTASDETSVNNSLQTKLQTKLLVSPSVINTQQLHRHYSGHHAMTNRLLQRLALPEQITSRYNAGILSTDATRSPAQRFQRKESFAEVRPLVNATVVQLATNPQWEQNNEPSNSSIQHQDLTVSAPPKQPYTAPFINSPEIPTFQRLSGQDSIPASPEIPSATYRISRRASNLDIFAKTNISNDSNDPVAESSNNLALSPPSLPLASSPETPSSPYRISRRPANFDNGTESNISASLLPLASSDAIANTPNALLGKANTSQASSQTLTGTGQIQPKIQPQLDPQLQLRENTASLSYPVLRETVPDSNNSIISKRTVDIVNPVSNINDLPIQRKYHQSELLMRSSQDMTGLSIKIGESNLSNQTINPTKSFNENPNENASVIRRVANPIDTIVQTKPLPLFSQSQLVMSPDQGDVLTNRSDLPLTIGANNMVVINRQPASAEFATSETINPLPPPPSNISPSNSNVDITEIAEKVSRIILRQLKVERERRGVSR